MSLNVKNSFISFTISLTSFNPQNLSLIFKNSWHSKLDGRILSLISFNSYMATENTCPQVLIEGGINIKSIYDDEELYFKLSLRVLFNVYCAKLSVAAWCTGCTYLSLNLKYTIFLIGEWYLFLRCKVFFTPILNLNHSRLELIVLTNRWSLWKA